MGLGWVRVGAKCTLSRTAKSTATYQEKQPSFGEILTIRSIYVDNRDITLLRFVEIVNPAVQTLEGFHERAFEASYFSPVISQADDMEMFRTLLNPTPLERLDRLMEQLNEQ